MKEIQSHHKDKIAIVKQAEQHAKQQVHFGSVRVVKGTKLYQFNLESYELSEVALEVPPKRVYSKKLAPLRLKANHTPGCLYVRAINFKNAVRKIKAKLPNINPVIIK